MENELLHLDEHESLRVIRDGRDELEVEATWEPGGSAPPPHFHPAQEEYFEVRSGSLTAVVDGSERVLRSGETLTIPRGSEHKMWNAGNETATAVWRTRPGGRTISWFRTIDRITDAGHRRPPLPVMAKALTEYSDVFRLALRPKPLRPLSRVAFRVLALAAR